MKSASHRIVCLTVVAVTLLAAVSCSESMAVHDATAPEGCGSIDPIDFHTVECVVLESSVREIRMPPGADGSYTVARTEVVVYGHLWVGTPDRWLVQRTPRNSLSNTPNICPNAPVVGRTCTRVPAADTSVLATHATETMRPLSNAAGALFASCGTVTHANLVRYDAAGTILNESDAEPVEERYEVQIGER